MARRTNSEEGQRLATEAYWRREWQEGWDRLTERLEREAEERQEQTKREATGAAR
jgi:hypothetical protein